MKKICFKTKYFGLITVLAVLSSCSIDDGLQQFQQSAPQRISGLAWPNLAPIGAFAPTREFVIILDPLSLAQRVTNLRKRARQLQGPVLDPRRARAMRAALARYYQG